MWPGLRPLANEVGERQAKSLPLGLYCLYRGLVIGGYGSGIKRLLPQPVRRVRHSLPPPLLFLSPSSHLLPHLSILFKRKRSERPMKLGPSMAFSLILSSLCLTPSVSACCLPNIMSVVWCTQVAGSVAPHAALLSGSVAVGCVVQWLVV